MHNLIFTFLLLCTLIAAPAHASTGFVQSFEWRAPEGALATGLLVFRKTPVIYAERMLFESSTGGRFVLSARLDARAGTDTVRLTDDATGWWLEVVLNYKRSSPDMKTFLRTLHPEENRLPKTIAISFRTREGQSFALPAVAYSPRSYEQHETLANRFRKDGRELQMPEDVKKTLLEQLPLLDAALGDAYQGNGYSFRAPIDFLRVILGTEKPSTRITVAVLRRTRGPVLTHSDDISLAGRFRGISTPIEPLGAVE